MTVKKEKKAKPYSKANVIRWEVLCSLSGLCGPDLVMELLSCESQLLHL